MVEWCNWNKLSLNPEKSEFLIVTNRDLVFEPQLYIGTDPIRRVQVFKYLGVYLDSKLKFGTQFDRVYTRLSQLCGVTYRLKNFINFTAAKNVYYSCAYSVLSYCILAWGGASQCSNRACNILKVQTRIMKDLFSPFINSAQGSLFKYTEILKFPDVYRYKVGVHMYKIMILNEASSLANALDIGYPEHGYETRNVNLLRLPFPRVEAVRESFSYQFIKIWNNIPDYAKTQPTLGAFKRCFRKILLDQY